MGTLIDFFLHLDERLTSVVAQHGPWVYGILFLVVFCETGLLIFPFLPGDSLLFAAGVVSGLPHSRLDFWAVSFVLFAAAVIGDSTNFWIGRGIGARLYSNPRSKVFKKKHLEAANAYFDRHGARTIVIGRFVPIVRTLTPFVAGMQDIAYRRFLKYSVIGSLLWVAICCGAGRLFGGIPVVQEHFSTVILGVAGATLLLAVLEGFRSRKHQKASPPSESEGRPASPSAE